MKTAISVGLMLLLASCAAPEKQSGTHSGKTAARRSPDTLRPKYVTVAYGADVRESRRAGLPSGYRSYGMVELPPPIASRNTSDAPAYQPPDPPRRVINNVTNGPLSGTEAAPTASVDVTPTGAYRAVINQVTNRPLHSGDAGPKPAGTSQAVINEVNNQPLSGTEASNTAAAVPPRTSTQRTVISPITNQPVQ